VIVPNNLVFGHVAQNFGTNQVASSHLIRFTAMLCPHLNDEISSQDRVAGRLGLFENIAHRLFNVGVLAGFHRHFQDGRVGVLRCRNNHRVDVF